MPIGEISAVVKRRVGAQVYYFGTVGSDKLKGITTVPVIEASTKTFLNEDVKDGYQRPGSQTRMRLFAKYLKDNPNSVVPPILLSSREGWQFQPTNGETVYGRLVVNAAAFIIDGQHRAGGYVALFTESGDIRPVDFIILEGLTKDQEIAEFTTVNSTQKGVPKPLFAFLEGEWPAALGWALSEQDDSPFKGRISRVKVASNQLFALHSVAKQIERLFSHGKLQNLPEDQKLEYLIRYWTIIAEENEDEWSDIKKLDAKDSRGRRDFEYKLLELTGWIAWSMIGYEILGRSYIEGAGMHWDNVRKLVSAAGQVDWRKNGQYAHATGEVGGPIIFRDMQKLLPPDMDTMTEAGSES